MDFNREIASYFDQLAPSWDNNASEYSVRDQLVSMMRLPSGGVIADIGCGQGVLFAHLFRTNPAKIIAVDISGEMLRGAKQLFDDDRIEYIHNDFLAAQLPTFDAAILFNSYPHFLDKNALTSKCAQVIKKNGILIIAHSQSKAKINRRHTGGSMSALSVPLKDAETEAHRFLPFFEPDVLIDNKKFYFIRMLRK